MFSFEYKLIATVLLVLFNLTGCQEDFSNKTISGNGNGPTIYQNMTSKDVQLLYGDKNMQTDSLPERISKLKYEISKGEKVYTQVELKILERKLADYENQYRVIHHP